MLGKETGSNQDDDAAELTNPEIQLFHGLSASHCEKAMPFETAFLMS